MDPREGISLVVLLAAFVVMLVAARRLPRWKYLVIAFMFPVITGITTIAEDFVLHDPLNYIEHISWMAGAAVFCWAVYKFGSTKRGNEK